MFSVFLAVTQISDGGMPYSFILKKHQTPIAESYVINKIDIPDLELIAYEDQTADRHGKPYRIAVNLDVNYDIKNSGTWTILPNGDKIWRLGIQAAEAKALGLYLSDKLFIPEGGELHIYNSSHSQYIGAFTSETDNFTAFEMIQGDQATLEYFMPSRHQVLPIINIHKVAYFYRGVGERMLAFKNARPVDTDRAASCQVDVKCSEINGWEEQRDAVVKYTFMIGTGTFQCSGSIVNNTLSDCKPYILTANHCGEPKNSGDIQNHVWYFNYQRPSCSPGNTIPYNGAQSQTMSGGLFRASSALGNHLATATNQVDGCDFALVELNTAIPTEYNPFYAGWSRSNSNSPSGVSIHHPSGDEKKISTYTSSLTSHTYNNGWLNAHWRVYWAATTNGHGVTEGGSSGAPIFNNAGKIIGHLSGGASSCNVPGQADLFGKFNKAWNQDGANISSQLQPWLDPGNTGVTELDGSYTPCGVAGTVYCDASSSQCDEYISNVTLGGVSNSSACTNYAYYWQNQPFNMVPGLSYFLNITTAIVGGSTFGYEGDQIAAWIDWNADGDFTDANETVYSDVIDSLTTLPLQTIIVVPANAALGETRMRTRIMFDVTTEGPIEPCGMSNFGEVEDYQLNIGTELSTNEFSNSTVNVFPNPTTGLVNIDLTGISGNISLVTINDITGKTIFTPPFTKNYLEVDLSKYSKGLYFISVLTENKTLVKKIILK